MFGVWALSIWVSLTPIAFAAQIPPSEKLSADDNKRFAQELDRVRDLLGSANDKGSVQFQIARTYAAGGQYRDAMEWLQKVVHWNLGFDPTRDKLFTKLHSAKEFQSLVEEARVQTAPVSNSHLLAVVPESDLFPENIAYDFATKTFFLGSTFKDEIVRCKEHGACNLFVAPHRNGLGIVLGLKIDHRSRTLWTTSNKDTGASLRQYSLTSGQLISGYPLSGGHLFNDLVVSSTGEVFVTDTRARSVYRLSNGNSRLEPLAPSHVFTAANGIALSPDERTLFVSSFGDGITAIDLASQSTKPVSHPPDVCLGYIDGLYAIKGSLVAIQNGPMAPRIVRFVLSSDGSKITDMKVLERRNPLFDGITTGVLVGDQLYYVPNNQLDKVVGGKIAAGVTLDPLRILTVDVEIQ